MQVQTVIDLFTQCIYISAEISLPILGVALVLGLLVGVFQAATQINEATLTFLPKIVAMVLVLALISPWMIRRMQDFTVNIYTSIPLIVKGK